jgi:hypothetical protein
MLEFAASASEPQKAGLYRVPSPSTRALRNGLHVFADKAAWDARAEVPTREWSTQPADLDELDLGVRQSVD